MKVVGQLDVTVEYSTQQAVLPLYIVESAGPSLFGRNWLTLIRPEWESIKTLTSTPLSEVLERHKSVFEEGLGKLKGHEAKVDSSAQPRFCKARSVPYAWQEKLEEELERLQREYIIEPIQFADWAAPIVPMLKQDKKTL